MKQPKNIHDALRRIQALTSCIAIDVGNYLEDPAIYGSDYFEGIKDAALDAHLLTTWVRDTLSFDTGGE